MFSYGIKRKSAESKREGWIFQKNDHVSVLLLCTTLLSVMQNFIMFHFFYSSKSNYQSAAIKQWRYKSVKHLIVTNKEEK